MATELDTPQLNERESRKLLAQIREKIDEVGSELLRLYRGKGWAALGYTSFRECVQEELGKSASWACRQLKAISVREQLPQGSDLPERSVRELRRLPDGEQAGALDEARERFGDSPSSREIASVVDEHLTPCPNCHQTGRDDDGDCVHCHEPSTSFTSVPEEEEALEAQEEPKDATGASVGDQPGLGKSLLEQCVFYRDRGWLSKVGILACLSNVLATVEEWDD